MFNMSFSALGLSKSLLPIIAKQNYKTLYPIQSEAIPAILEGKDVLGIAKTGSGKTASYVLPLLTQISKIKGTRNRIINVLVLVPTRELAMQVHDVFHLFNSNFSEAVRTMAVYGGVSINPQMKKLNGVQILVATPGRLLELVESKALQLSEVQTLVLDEADKMLNLGFKEEMNRIFALLPKKRQNLLFSATLSNDISTMNQVLLQNPVVIKISQEKEDNINLIKQTVYLVSDEKKGPMLRYLIKHNNLNQVLIFTSSVHKADGVSDKLNKNGIQAKSIHSKKSQSARVDGLKKFKSGELRVLVTTDLLSRGIDIEFLPCVINYELPRSPKDFVHRIGRTGRAENPGEAITLLTDDDLQHFAVIQKKMGQQVEINIEEVDLRGF
jgi:ATP-dependent RNA helicase RhlE